MFIEQVLPAFRIGKKIRCEPMPIGFCYAACFVKFKFEIEGEENLKWADIVLLDMNNKFHIESEDRKMPINYLMDDTWVILD